MSNVPKGTADDPLVTTPAAPVPKGTEAEPVTVKTEEGVPSGAADEPITVRQSDNKTFHVHNDLWKAIIAGLIGLAMLHMNLRLAEVRSTVKAVEGTTTQTNEIAHETKAFVNSARGAQLRREANMARSLANISHDEIDIKAWREAEKDYQEHQAGQAQANAKVTASTAPVPATQP